METFGAIELMLFPHGRRDASVSRAIAAAVVVGLHGALESYSKALRISMKKGLPDAIRDRMAAGSTYISVILYDTLVDFDATRRAVVHNRGVVDEKYIRQVRNPPYLVEELRVLSPAIVDRFSSAVLQIGRLLHSMDT